jgi:DNA-binding NarL/FixJ family response regulator
MVPVRPLGASHTAASSGSISIIVADDQAIVRRGIASLLKLTPHFVVAAEAENGAEAAELAIRLEPDVVLMDIAMPVLNGFDAASRIKAEAGHVKVIMLSVMDGEEQVLEAIASGADGYVLKKSTPEQLAAAVRTVVHNRSGFVSPSFPPKLIAKLCAKAKRIDRQEKELTPRERVVMQLIAEGKTHEEISKLLDVSVRTVDTHRHNLMQKLDIHDAVTLVRLAVKMGLVQV